MDTVLLVKAEAIEHQKLAKAAATGVASFRVPCPVYRGPVLTSIERMEATITEADRWRSACALLPVNKNGRPTRETALDLTTQLRRTIQISNAPARNAPAGTAARSQAGSVPFLARMMLKAPIFNLHGHRAPLAKLLSLRSARANPSHSMQTIGGRALS
eukprot:6196172-Pleurochrysis_carterae.AAC.3